MVHFKGTPNPTTAAAVFSGVDNKVTEADMCELRVQEVHKDNKTPPDMVVDTPTYYAKADLIKPHFNCKKLTMKKGDTLYMPKGLVHYAHVPVESAAASIHMTVSLDRACGTWLDYVASTLNVPAERPVKPLLHNGPS